VIPATCASAAVVRPEPYSSARGAVHDGLWPCAEERRNGPGPCAQDVAVAAHVPAGAKAAAATSRSVSLLPKLASLPDLAASSLGFPPWGPNLPLQEQLWLPWPHFIVPGTPGIVHDLHGCQYVGPCLGADRPPTG